MTYGSRKGAAVVPQSLNKRACQTRWTTTLISRTRVRPLAAPKKMEVGQKSVPFGFGSRRRIWNGVHRILGRVRNCKTAGICDLANANELADVMRLRVDRYLPL